jgi:hypothetical protein
VQRVDAPHRRRCSRVRRRGQFLQRFFSGRCQHGAIEMKKTPVDTKQRVVAERGREVSNVIVFASWGS